MYDKWLTVLAPYFNWFIGVGVAIISYLFGGWNEALSLLAILALLDFITGISASTKEGIQNPDDASKGLSSKKGFKGIAKKAAMFAIIAVMYRIDVVLGLSGTLSLSAGVVYFYISNELISIAENYVRLGWLVPELFKKAIAMMQDKGNKM